MNLSQQLVTLGIATSLFLPTATLAESPQRDQEAIKIKAKTAITAGRSQQVKNLNGRVTSISGNHLMVLAASGVTYDVNATDAKIQRRYGATMTVADIQVNDSLEVKGELVAGSTNIIKAKSIRDLSLQARNAEFKGLVQSVGTNSFVLQTNNRSTQTIHLASSTVIKLDGATSSFSAITVGTTVEVVGIWNRTNNNVTATKVQVHAYPLTISFRGNLVETTSGTLLSIRAQNGLTYQVNATDAKIVLRNNASSSLSALRIGDLLEVKGKHAFGSTLIMANWIKNLSNPATSTANTRSFSVDLVTQANNNQTLGLNLHSLFFLKLGEGYDWNVSVQNQNIVRRIDGGLYLPHMQGLFQAASTGTTDIVAVGEPLCRRSSAPTPCATPSAQFVLHVNVR